MDWMNGNKIGFQKFKTIFVNLSNISPENTTQSVFIAMKNLFKETLIARDQIKSMELRNLHTIEVVREDLSKIYTQIQSLPL